MIETHSVFMNKTESISRILAVSSSFAVWVVNKAGTMHRFTLPRANRPLMNEYLGGKAKSLAHGSAVNADFVPPDRLFLPAL